MRVLLRLELDCTPDAAWRALRSPAVFRSVAAPLLEFSSVGPGGFPAEWAEGPHPVSARAFGVLPIGGLTSVLTFEQRGDVRLLHDRAEPEAGALQLITFWHHTMAVSPLPGGRTLYRDQLRFEAWLAIPFLWPALWAFWQWRARRIQSLAPTW